MVSDHNGLSLKMNQADRGFVGILFRLFWGTSSGSTSRGGGSVGDGGESSGEAAPDFGASAGLAADFVASFCFKAGSPEDDVDGLSGLIAGF
jgi:hypothetical protein